MITSEGIIKITGALLSFHDLVGKIKKDSTNPFFKSKYADLAGILDAVSDPLQKSGLLITQFPECGGVLTTRLMHVSGEWMQSTLDLNAVPELLKEKDKNGNVVWRGDSYTSPQGQGSAITYARRYAQVAILNLNVDDDDGNAGSGRQLAQTQKPAIQVKKPLTKTQLSQAIDRIKNGEKDLIQKLQESFSLTSDQVKQLNSIK